MKHQEIVEPKAPERNITNNSLDDVADDLEFLVFGGNAELPSNVLDHLPAIRI